LLPFLERHDVEMNNAPPHAKMHMWKGDFFCDALQMWFSCQDAVWDWLISYIG
jgi:hypothetical protein